MNMNVSISISTGNADSQSKDNVNTGMFKYCTIFCILQTVLYFYSRNCFVLQFSPYLIYLRHMSTAPATTTTAPATSNPGKIFLFFTHL